jgi:hypothetical protein
MDYRPEQLVALFRERFKNKSSLSSEISRLKSLLKKLDQPPCEEYLCELKLDKKEYSELNKIADKKRQQAAMQVKVIKNAPEIVKRAQTFLKEGVPELVFIALLVLTGCRPVELLRVAQFEAPTCNHGKRHRYFAAQTAFAKRRQDDVQSRDRPFLAPFKEIQAGLALVRKNFSCEGLNNTGINNKWCAFFNVILRQHFPELVTMRMCRRFFALYSYETFGRMKYNGETETDGSLIAYSSHVLGHDSGLGSAICYQSLKINAQPLK